MLIVAHRGGSNGTPEDTLAAFSNAVKIGADMIELDIHVSKDGVPVVIHDHTLERTTNGTGDVNSYTVAELQQFDAGQGEKIPTLAEVFALIGDRIRFILELKTIEAVPATVDLLRANPQVRWVGFSTHDEALDQLRVAFPEAELSFGTMGSREVSIKLADVLGQANIAHYKSFAERLRQDAENFDIENVFARAAELPAVKIGFYYESIDAGMVDLVHTRGYQIGAFTVNDVAEGKRLLALGVDSLTTDDPAAMIAMVAEAGVAIA